MALQFQPKVMSVVICDFTGFVIPEMVKIRPVVVLARNKQNHRLVTIVPLSTTMPKVIGRHHHAFSVNPLLDKPHTPCWAKCDMLYTVSISRLDRYRIAVGRFVIPTVSKADFEVIREGVASALNLADT